jgi:hypothetical protein
MDRSKTTTRQALRNAHLPGSVCCTIGALVAAFVTASTASAHVTVAPPYLDADGQTRVEFQTPNERPPHATVSLVIDAPRGFVFAAADPPKGWQLQLEQSNTRARWTGGRITGQKIVAFPILVTAGTRAGLASFRAQQLYDDVETVRWNAEVTVLPATGSEAPSQHLDRAIAAGAVGLVVIAASFFALRLVRRRPLQER